MPRPLRSPVCLRRAATSPQVPTERKALKVGVEGLAGVFSAVERLLVGGLAIPAVSGVSFDSVCPEVVRVVRTVFTGAVCVASTVFAGVVRVVRTVFASVVPVPVVVGVPDDRIGRSARVHVRSRCLLGSRVLGRLERVTGGRIGLGVRVRRIWARRLLGVSRILGRLVPVVGTFVGGVVAEPVVGPGFAYRVVGLGARVRGWVWLLGGSRGVGSSGLGWLGRVLGDRVCRGARVRGRAWLLLGTSDRLGLGPSLVGRGDRRGLLARGIFLAQLPRVGARLRVRARRLLGSCGLLGLAPSLVGRGGSGLLARGSLARGILAQLPRVPRACRLTRVGSVLRLLVTGGLGCVVRWPSPET